MTEKAIKQSFKGTLKFNHKDALFARFSMSAEDAKPGHSSMYGRREFSITPEMFPDDFELAKYDVSGTFEFTVEIKPKT